MRLHSRAWKHCCCATLPLQGGAVAVPPAVPDMCWHCGTLACGIPGTVSVMWLHAAALQSRDCLVAGAPACARALHAGCAMHASLRGVRRVQRSCHAAVNLSPYFFCRQKTCAVAVAEYTHTAHFYCGCGSRPNGLLHGPVWCGVPAPAPHSSPYIRHTLYTLLPRMLLSVTAMSYSAECRARAGWAGFPQYMRGRGACISSFSACGRDHLELALLPPHMRQLLGVGLAGMPLVQLPALPAFPAAAAPVVGGRFDRKHGAHATWSNLWHGPMTGIRGRAVCTFLCVTWAPLGLQAHSHYPAPWG